MQIRSEFRLREFKRSRNIGR